MGEATQTMDSFIQGAKDLADATERAAKTKKCQAEIMYANRTITQIKEAFGVKVWDAVLAGDMPTVEALMAEDKALVDAQTEVIQGKEAEIERLSKAGGR